jgi:hypothetical protein
MLSRALSLFLAAGAAMALSSYENEVMEWRNNRAATLKAEDGWLSLAGLYWLHPGSNTFGKDQSSDLVLPDGSAHAGSFEFHTGKVTLNGRDLKPNDAAPALTVGRAKLFLIQRSGKIGIRVKDPQSDARRNFHGLEYFPISERFRITAQWVAEPQDLPILNVIGQTEPQPSPGYAVFHLNGHEYKLRPYIEVPGDKQLFYVFKDQTAGKETYGAGRFFYSDFPHDGKVVLDFNKAYSPPCAFTPYATCPLPPPENRLAVRIEAGEKKYGDH